MKTFIVFCFICAGFVPAIITATTTDGFLQFMDYISIITGMLMGSIINDMKTGAKKQWKGW